MRLRVFQATDGDCLLLSSDDDRHMLIDGGRSGTFSKHTAPHLKDLAALDIICVSHIDADHITGILTLLGNEIDWRIHLHEKTHPPVGRRAKRKPKSPKPPEIGEIWHNGFSDQLGENAGDVHDMLSLAAQAQFAFAEADIMPREHFLRDLALGEEQAIELSHRISEDQLDIPLNKHFGGKLARSDMPGDNFRLGTIDLTVIGPSIDDLNDLKEQWEKWVEDNQTKLDNLQKDMDEDAAKLGLAEADSFLANMQQLMSSSGDFTHMGKRSEVTTPNLASIMVLAEESGRSLLLTGDGSWEDIIAGLGAAGKLDQDGLFHTDILKVPNHVAIANINLEFLQTIIADSYVFCGNGAHHNPEIDVIKAIAEARFGAINNRSKHPNNGNGFSMVFNNTEASANTDNRKKHMKELIEETEKLAARSNGQMSAIFHNTTDADFFDINL